MDKVIRATIEVELPYDNELLNYNTKLQKEILRVLESKNFGCKVQSGYLKPSKLPTNRLKNED